MFVVAYIGPSTGQQQAHINQYATFGMLSQLTLKHLIKIVQTLGLAW